MCRTCAALLLLISSLTLAQPTPQSQQPAPPTGLARLRANIEQIASSVDTHWAIYMKCLDTNEEIAINADEQMDTMSVIKPSRSKRGSVETVLNLLASDQPVAASSIFIRSLRMP